MTAIDISIFQLESQQFEEMEQALSAWDHKYRQMSPGDFRGVLQHTQVGDCGIFRNRWERAIHYQGTAPAGTVGFAISLAQTGEARWMGQRVGIDDVIVQRSGKEAEYLSGSLWDSVVFAIPEFDLCERIENLTQSDPEKVLENHEVVRLKPQVAARFRQASLQYLSAAQQLRGGSDDAHLVGELAQNAISLVAKGLASAQSTKQSQATLKRRIELVRKATDSAADRTDEPVRIGELCRELKVSERTLRHAFYDVTGRSPLEYLKTFRLNQVKRHLREAVAGEALVKQLAYANGFTHLGQFSRYYRQLFGELPSQTLHRK